MNRELQLLEAIRLSQERIFQMETAIRDEEREQRELKNKLQSIRRKQND